MVSIVITTYNRAAFLEQCLASLFVQNRPDLQIIVVDDGSEDGTEKMMETYAGKVHYEPLTYNVGVQRARNHGRKLVRGELVIYSDDDVVFKDRAIDMFEQALNDNPDKAYAYCDFDRIGYEQEAHKAFTFNRDLLKQQNYISMVSMVRSELVPEFDNDIHRLQDWDMWLTLLEQGHEGVYVPEQLFSAWVLPDGISKRVEETFHTARNKVLKKHGLD